MLSFFYECSKCGHSFEVIEMNFKIYREDDKKEFESHKDLVCPKCGAKYEELDRSCDEIIEDY